MTLFEGTAWYYARYRRGHSPDLAPAFAELFQLDGGGQLLDLGTGTGAIALALANHFAAVVAIDPDASMLSEAARAARERGLANVQFIHARAEELGDSHGKFRLITVGSAFHWMDRDKVLNIAHHALVPSGVFAIIESSGKATDTSGSALPLVPWDCVHEVVSHYLGPKRRAGRGFYAAPDESYEDMLDRSLFGGHQSLTLPGVPATRSVEDVIGYLFSTSYASRQQFGDRVAAFEDGLRRELLKASPSGEFFEPARPTEVIYSQKNERVNRGNAPARRADQGSEGRDPHYLDPASECRLHARRTPPKAVAGPPVTGTAARGLKPALSRVYTAALVARR